MPINNFLLPGAKTTPAYEVANSVRFNGADSPALKRNSMGTATNRKKWTLSMWVKRSTTDQRMLASFDGAKSYFQFQSGGQLEVNDVPVSTFNYRLVTNAVYRDVSAWMHIVVAFDSTQGTDSNRLKLYVNGEQPSLGTATYPSSDFEPEVNSTGSHKYGSYDDSTDFAFDGYFAEIVFIDGTQYAASDFGEFDSDSPQIWKPKDPSGLTFGTNGHYLDFESSGTLGNDINGGTDFDANNLAATDQCVDTCTNNFATINSLDNYWAGATFSEGNTKVVTGSSNEAMSTSTFAMTRGKWYFEVDNMSGAGARICGITPTVSFSGGGHGKAGDVTPHTVSYVAGGAVQEGDGSGGQSTLATYASYANGDIIGVYMDLDNMKAYFSKNGSLQSSTGINMEPLASNGTGHYMFFVGDNNTGSRTVEANFGNPFQTQTSSVADDNGYGKFEYSPNITGDGSAKSFYACCTKNLAEFG